MPFTLLNIQYLNSIYLLLTIQSSPFVPRTSRKHVRILQKRWLTCLASCIFFGVASVAALDTDQADIEKQVILPQKTDKKPNELDRMKELNSRLLRGNTSPEAAISEAPAPNMMLELTASPKDLDNIPASALAAVTLHSVQRHAQEDKEDDFERHRTSDFNFDHSSFNNFQSKFLDFPELKDMEKMLQKAHKHGRYKIPSHLKTKLMGRKGTSTRREQRRRHLEQDETCQKPNDVCDTLRGCVDRLGEYSWLCVYTDWFRNLILFLVITRTIRLCCPICRERFHLQ